MRRHSWLLLVPLAAAAMRLAADSVILVWDPNTEPFLGGYRVYYGTQSRFYGFDVRDVGLSTTCRVDTLSPGRVYYFAATAYSTNGLESDFSEEVSWMTSNTVPTLAVSTNRIVVAPGATSAVVRVTIGDAETPDPADLGISITTSNSQFLPISLVSWTRAGNSVDLRVKGPASSGIAGLRIVAEDPCAAQTMVFVPVLVGTPPQPPKNLRVRSGLQASVDLRQWDEIARIEVPVDETPARFFRMELRVIGDEGN